jgi:hypothetical protein
MMKSKNYANSNKKKINDQLDLWDDSMALVGSARNVLQLVDSIIIEQIFTSNRIGSQILSSTKPLRADHQ